MYPVIRLEQLRGKHAATNETYLRGRANNMIVGLQTSSTTILPVKNNVEEINI